MISGDERAAGGCAVRGDAGSGKIGDGCSASVGVSIPPAVLSINKPTLMIHLHFFTPNVIVTRVPR